MLRALGVCLFFFSLLFPREGEAKKKFILQEREASYEDTSLKVLWSSLDPLSLSQQLAFYELYSTTPEGKQALQKAWELLGMKESGAPSVIATLPSFDIQGLLALITRQSLEPTTTLSEEQLSVIERLGASLSNRHLKGHTVWSKEDALALKEEEMDLARTLLLFQFDSSPESKKAIRQYEASLDLMALQVRARLSKTASQEEKIKEINRFIFQEMQFRFPPHSLHAADIDLYTFLPSVLDGRQGVCLGVSILYLSLAQRLDLPLEIITPPGHIYVRYHEGEKLINVETTLRGVNLPSETYLGINTHRLQQRTLREVVGLAFMNQASVCWSRGKHKEAVSLYEKAWLFMPQDRMLKMFLGLNYLFIGKEARGVELLRELRSFTPEDAVSSETIPQDYLEGKVDKEGLKAVFLPVDETRTSILQKQKELERILKRYPAYRAGLLQLATTWLQLGRYGEARDILERYHHIDPHHCVVEYYLSALCTERLDYDQAWKHLKQLESLLESTHHQPKALLSLKRELQRSYPEP